MNSVEETVSSFEVNVLRSNQVPISATVNLGTAHCKVEKCLLKQINLIQGQQPEHQNHSKGFSLENQLTHSCQCGDAPCFNSGSTMRKTDPKAVLGDRTGWLGHKVYLVDLRSKLCHFQ